MAFKLPDDLSAEKDLQKLLDQAMSESKTLAKISDEDMTDEQLTELESLSSAAAAIKDEQAKRISAQDERSQRIAAAKANLGAVDPDDASPEDTADTTDAADAAAGDAPADDPAAAAPVDADPTATDAPADAPADVTDPALADPVDPAMDPAVDTLPIPDDISGMDDTPPADDPTDSTDEEDPTKKEKEPVTASAGSPTTKSAAQRAAANAPEVDGPPVELRPKATITASANLNDYNAGQELEFGGSLIEAFSQKLQSLPKHKIADVSMQRHGVASIRKGVSEEFKLKRGDNEQNMSKITAAAADYKARLMSAGSPQAMVAAGGWCAPSETIYDIPTLEEVAGILNVAEVTVEHGGIAFTKGPDFADIYTDSGFLQTEAQAEAGTEKNFIDVECPGFEEVRLDAIGFGVRAGILTNAAWPELVQRYLEGTLVAHAHKVNAYKINKISALALAASPGGVAITAQSLGAAVPDSLAALEMQAVRLRYKFRMNPDTPMEGFAPIWFMSVLRADLAYQQGKDTKDISEAEVNGWLSARKISLQWVYDYQDLAPEGTTYPTTVNVTLYPVGTYVAGTSDVISLDAVYDTASLITNTYTAAFFEEGVMIFNPVANGVVVKIPLVAYGRFGANDITNLVAA